MKLPPRAVAALFLAAAVLTALLALFMEVHKPG